MKLKQIHKRILVVVVLIGGVLLFGLWQNNGVQTTSMSITSSRIPKEFDKYTIVQVSDLHNKRFGSHQSALLRRIDNSQPDGIVVTGDLIDCHRLGMQAALELIRGAVKIAPVYYVAGNHEAWSPEEYPQLITALEESGVTILNNTSTTLTNKDTSMTLIGLSDPDFTTLSSWKEQLSKLAAANQDDTFRILLSHRPEQLAVYAEYGMDLVFSGHAHGGQVRLPFISGLVAPNQGYFPEYTQGSYEQGNTTLIVSRGLGNSIIPLRLFNRPELVVVTLHAE